MEFKYINNSVYLIDKSRNILIEQKINQFNMTPIDNIDDANKLVIDYLNREFNAAPIFFNMEIMFKEERVDSLLTNITYNFIIKESLLSLNGVYNISISNSDDNDILYLDLLFVDGISNFEYSFNSKGKYTINFDNEFFIDDNKYMSVIPDIETISFFVKDNTRAINLL